MGTNLSDEVVKFLMMDHAFCVEDAETAVAESMEESPDMWNENAEAEDLANFLASDDNDE